MRRYKNKDNMNTLLNIDSVFGEYEGHVLPVVITIGLVALPLLLWLFFLQRTPIKFWYVLIFDVFWGLRWALKILGKENEKMKFYLQQRSDEYKSADELVHVNHVHDNGLIEYDNGTTAFIISGFFKGYLTDDKLSVDLENFMNELDNWNWDFYLHNVVDELLCEEGLPNLKRYTDKQVIQERIDFYDYQDEWSRTHTALYRISFLVWCPKYNWKRLQSHMEELVSSELANMFNEIAIFGYDEVMDIFNRDICGYADIRSMLTKKFDNEEYYGSKVLWYDDNIPNAIVPEKDKSSLEERRVSR